MNDIDSLLPIVIPAYEPNSKMIDFLKDIRSAVDSPVILVDDGSGSKYRHLFDKAEEMGNIVIIRHAENLGKGRSLKDAFNYVLLFYPQAIGVVTADCDGQHLIEDIVAVSKSLSENPCHLILGCRDFHKEGIPWKSKFGNTLTRRTCAFLCGINVSDTQTGLRGIPLSFMKILMHTPGERFEYETNMLLECNNGIGIVEVPISTVYESRDNHKTHFDPLRDSITIYKVILAYSLSSLLATFSDFIVFTLLTVFGNGIWLSTALSRASAAAINFLLNKNVVFKAKGNGLKQLLKYMLLVIVSGTLSALLVSEIGKLLSINVIIIKAIVETCLFFFNYYIQRSFIFAKRKGNEVTKSLFSEEIVNSTDWTQYYEKKKSWVSTWTQRYTLRCIKSSINKYVSISRDYIDICELGGGNSCFAKEVCNSTGVNVYDIVDSNNLAVSLFDQMDLCVNKKRGKCRNLLDEFDKSETAKYDFVYSIGLIEHFRANDIKTIIERHFDYCKDDGIVMISFPTPTAKYIFTRKCMELVGAWQFHDEKPIKFEELSDWFDFYGIVLEHYKNRKLPLTQEVVILRKSGNRNVYKD